MQSENYVAGVSGWKMHSDGRLEVAGTVRVATGEAAVERSKPFVVVDGVTYICAEEVARATVTSAKIGPRWSVNMKLHAGNHVAVGIDIGSQAKTAAENLAIKEDRPKSSIEQGIDDGHARKILDLIAGTISETELFQSLLSKNDPRVELVRSVIRDELRPGGLLHRSSR